MKKTPQVSYEDIAAKRGAVVELRRQAAELETQLDSGLFAEYVGDNAGAYLFVSSETPGIMYVGNAAFTPKDIPQLIAFVNNWLAWLPEHLRK